MRKYTAPCAEKISFDYKNQVVASNSGTISVCRSYYTLTNEGKGCKTDEISFEMDNGD